MQEVIKRLTALGVDFHATVLAVGLSRNTGFKLKRGTGSVGSLRKIEDWLVREEHKRGAKRSTKDPVAEWSSLGGELLQLDPQRFDAVLEGVRAIVEARQKESAALLQMFRPTPDYRK